MIFLYHKLHLSERPTYFYTLRERMLAGFLFGALTLAPVVVQKSLNGSDWHVSLLAVFQPLGMVFGMFWANIIAKGEKIAFVFWPQVLACVLLLFMPLVDSPTFFTILVGMVPFLISITIPARLSIFRRNISSESRATMLGFVNVRYFFIAAVTAYLFGYILDIDYNIFKIFYPICALLGILGSFQFKKIKVRKEDYTKHNTHSSISDVLSIFIRDKRYRRYLISIFIFGLANLMTLPLFAIFIVKELKVDYKNASLVLTVIPQLAYILTTGTWGRLLDKHSPLFLRAIFNFIWSIDMLCIFFAPGIGLVYLGKLIRGSVLGGSSLVWNLGPTYYAKEEELPHYMGLHLTLTGIRAIIGPILGLWLSHIVGLRNVFLISFFMMILAGILMLNEAIRERKKLGRWKKFSDAEKEHSNC